MRVLMSQLKDASKKVSTKENKLVCEHDYFLLVQLAKQFSFFREQNSS